MMDDARYYGVYAGVCVDINDPESRSRIRLKVRQILGDAVTNWAEACLPVTSNHTHSNHTASITSSSAGTPSHTHSVSVNLSHTNHDKVPRLNQSVWVMFVGGDPNFPIWIGVAP